MPEWSAEVAVDAALVGRLVAGQFPEVALRSVGLLAEGWDNTVWWWTDLGVPPPRRAVAIAGVEREIAVLPRLAPFLRCRYPSPSSSATPPRGFPGPSSVAGSCPAGRSPTPASPKPTAVVLRDRWERSPRRLHQHDLAGRFDERPADRTAVATCAFGSR